MGDKLTVEHIRVRNEIQSKTKSLASVGKHVNDVDIFILTYVVFIYSNMYFLYMF